MTTIPREHARKGEVRELQRQRARLITEDNPEWAEILALRLRVAQDVASRGCLSRQTLDAVLQWKLRRQRARTERRRAPLTDHLIHELTGTAYRLQHPDQQVQHEVQLKVLMAIPGVGIGMASAILALTNPRQCGVIDYRTWKVLYGQDKRTFSVSDYRRYLQRLQTLAAAVGCDVQEVDYILWKMFEQKRRLSA